MTDTPNVFHERVRTEEFTSALRVLEARRIRELQETVSISQAIEELKLDVTPEEIWGEVQRQQTKASRTKKAAVAAGILSLLIVLCLIASLIVFFVNKPNDTQAAMPTQAASIVASDGFVIDEDKLTKTFDCTGQNVTINSNIDTLTLRGTVETLVINGSYATVTVGSAKTIVLNGIDNSVTWHGKNPPKIVDHGFSNTVGHG